MTGTAINDRLSLVLMSALQLQPRASWSALAPILGVSTSTLARRWQSLTEERLVWTTCLPTLPTDLDPQGSGDWFFLAPHGTTAYIELTCSPGGREAVLNQLLGDPRCWTIAFTSGPRDLTIAATLPSPRALDEFLQLTVGAVPEVQSMRANPLRGFLQSPTSWRIGALSPAQRDAIIALHPRTSQRLPLKRTHSGPSPLELAVIRELGFDARMTASQIARNIGYSVSSVNDAIATIRNLNMAEFRLDFDQAAFGWNVTATLALRAPQSRIHEIGTQLRRFSMEVREAVLMVGGANLQVHIWTKHMETIDAVEEMLETQFPEVHIADRWLSTRFAKRAGVVLDETGRRVTTTPLVGGIPT